MNSFIKADPVQDAHLYEREYFDSYYLNDRRREAMYEQEHARILARTKPGTVLDIGCGIGGFLSVFDDRWEKFGFEPSDFAEQKAQKRGIKMLHHVQDLGFSSADLVILRGSLQHINFPMRTLHQATSILKSGGLLAILATPNINSVVYKLWGNLPALDTPRNWVLFSDRILSNILQRLEYSDIEVIYPYWETPYARPWSDFSKFLLSMVGGYRPFAFPRNMMEVYAVKK